MDGLKAEDEAALAWLSDKPARFWSRSHFRTYCKCDILVNNMCESFNHAILKARDRPILTMLQVLYNYLMQRMQVNRDAAQKMQPGQLCPRVFKKFEKEKNKTNICIPRCAGRHKYQITCMYGDQYATDLEQRTCTCRRWDLNGLPCNHAISAIYRTREKVDDCYEKEAY